MSVYNLILYSDRYSNTSGISWQYCRGEPARKSANGNLADFNIDNGTTDMFKVRGKKHVKQSTIVQKVLK